MKLTDQIGQNLEFASPPQRIISLVPSLTELLFDLGLGDQIIAVTKFCERPSNEVKNKLEIGGTKTPRIEIIKVLKPDFIIAAREENLEEHIDELRAICPCYVSNIKSIPEVFNLIKDLSSIFELSEIGDKLIDDIIYEQSLPIDRISMTALYLIWRDPYMAAGGDTFINEMIEWAGFENVLKHIQRYPNLAIEKIQELNPNLVLLSSEPYPFKDKHIKEISKFLPNAQVKLVDGQSFSWYGSRLRYAFRDIRALIRSLKK